MIRSLLLVLLIGPTPAQAGDYLLVIADADVCSDAKPTSTVYSSAEVSANLDRHFSGADSDIGIFRAAFSNARVAYCGPAERAAIEDSLISWALRGPSANAADLYDYFLMLGSRRVATQLDILVSIGQSPGTTARLKRAQQAVARGLELRSD